MNAPAQQKTLTDYAVEEWYRRTYPMNPRNRARVIAEEYGIDPDALHEACQADFAERAESD